MTIANPLTEWKTLAEAWRRTLLHGLASLREVVAWADEGIGASAEPPYWLIEVSLAKSTEAAEKALGSAPGDLDTARLWAVLTRSWLELLQRDPERDLDIGRTLYHLGMNGDVPAAGLEDTMRSFWDAIELARSRVWGSRDEERARLAAFLAQCCGGPTEPHP